MFLEACSSPNDSMIYLFSNLHAKKVTWFQAYYYFSTSNIHQIPVFPSLWFAIHPFLAFFPPLAPRQPIHASNENLFSYLSLPVIPSSLSSPSILHLLLMVISLSTLFVLFPWHGYWQQQTSVIFNFILALAFPVSSSSPSVFNAKPTPQIDTLSQVARSSPTAISIRIGSCACLGEEALSRQGTTFLFLFLSIREMVLGGKSLRSSRRSIQGLVAMVCEKAGRATGTQSMELDLQKLQQLHSRCATLSLCEPQFSHQYACNVMKSWYI